MEPITVQNKIKASVDKTWKYWSEPEHIKNWCAASDDWHSPHAENDLKTGGKFLTRMEAKDKSFGFDFTGIYTDVKINEVIAYTMEDGRKATITFSGNDKETTITETFDPETINPIDMQRAGWQAILDNFKRYTETN